MLPADTGRTFTARFVPSIRELDRHAWDDCFPGEIEGYGYHAGAEASGIGGFSLGWYVVEYGQNLVAAAAAFETRYDLDTTAQGRVRKVLTAMKPYVPGRLSLALSSLGSPVTETCPIGFSGSLNGAARASALACLLDFWQQHAQSRGIALLGVKDLADNDRLAFGHVFEQRRFQLVSGLPSADLKISFTELDGYLGSLSPATRKDLRRKLKSREDIRVEDTHDIAPVIGEIAAMYRETRARSDWAFEELEPAYFTNVIAAMPETAFFKLYWCGNSLAGANFLLCDGRTLLDKFFVMREEVGRKHNLYFLSWIENVEHCLRNDLKCYKSGQAGYETKLRLSAALSPNWLGFKHRNRLLHAGLRLAAPLLAVAQPVPKPKSET